jgi:hypothetical protein
MVPPVCGLVHGSHSKEIRCSKMNCSQKKNSGGTSVVYKHFLVYHKIANVAHSNLSHATTSARMPYYHLLILAAARRVGCDIPTRAILSAFAFFRFSWFAHRLNLKTLHPKTFAVVLGGHHTQRQHPRNRECGTGLLQHIMSCVQRTRDHLPLRVVHLHLKQCDHLTPSGTNALVTTGWPGQGPDRCSCCSPPPSLPQSSLSSRIRHSRRHPRNKPGNKERGGRGETNKMRSLLFKAHA